MPQRRDAAIVGIHEYPLRVAPGVSSLQIKADSAAAALEDAGLRWCDVDALYDTAAIRISAAWAFRNILALNRASSIPPMWAGAPLSFRPTMPSP